MLSWIDASIADFSASILQSTAQAAHKAFASLAAAAPLKVGDSVPDVEIKINNMEEKINLSKLTGKNVLVLVPGAYVPTQLTKAHTSIVLSFQHD